MTYLQDNWKLHIYGVRGSFPCPNIEYMEYGGNTSCFLLECTSSGQKTWIIFDAGSGMQKLSMNKLIPDNATIHIMISHMHLDHICGFMSLTALFEKTREIHIYGLKRDNLSVREQFESVFSPPRWPIGLSDLSARLVFHDLQESDSFEINNIHIQAVPTNHPDHCIGYLLQKDKLSFGYALDCETDEKLINRFSKIFNDCNLIVYDATFHPGKEIPGWGHSSWKQASELRKTAHIKKLLAMHYSPQDTDQILHTLEKEAKEEDPQCIYGKEGMIISI